MKFATKIFWVGATLGGASGVMPLVKVGHSTNSTLSKEMVGRMHGYGRGKTGVCLGVDEESENIPRNNGDGKKVRFVFWLQKGAEGGCKKFTVKKDSEAIKKEMLKFGWWRVVVDYNDWLSLLKKVEKEEIPRVAKVNAKGNENKLKNLEKNLKSVLVKVGEKKLSAEETPAQKVFSERGEENLLQLAIGSLVWNKIGHWTWIAGTGN